MKQLLLTCAMLTLMPFAAGAASIDIIGGPDTSAQTMHHCGFLPVSKGNFTDSSITTTIVEHKLTKLGFLHKPSNGIYNKTDKQAVRAFQADAGLSPDGVVGPLTAQRLAYFAHPSTNVHRCYRNAVTLR